jgi:hypothetical protein
MTVTPPGPPEAPYGPPAGLVPMPPSGPDGSHWPSPTRRTSMALAAGIAVTAVLAMTALVVNVIDLTRRTSTAATSAPRYSSVAVPPVDTTDADRALCTAIAPLMTENDKFYNQYAALGKAGTPARDAATPQFITDTKNWLPGAQKVLDQHPDASPYLRRTMQRYFDDQNLLVLDLRPGPLTAYWKSVWDDSIGAYIGPIEICKKVGVRW